MKKQFTYYSLSLFLAVGISSLFTSCASTPQHPESAIPPGTVQHKTTRDITVAAQQRIPEPKFKIYTNDIPVPEETEIEPLSVETSDGSAELYLPPAVQPQPVVDSSTVPREVVTIDGTRYTIPAPWAGNRLKAPVFSLATFKQIPPIHVHDGKKTYLKKNAWQPLMAMILAARKDGIILQVETAYRSYDTQMDIFRRKFRQGRTWEDVVRYVAPPGYSEHMLGTVLDFYPSGWHFASTKAYAWLKQHAGEFGFIESYPEIKRSGGMPLTWESWHWRYIGKQIPPRDAAQVVPQDIEVNTPEPEEDLPTFEEIKAEAAESLSPSFSSDGVMPESEVLEEAPPDPGEMPLPPPVELPDF
jgi:LAS superfamily LD-carboxypeptidase LdcB